MSQEAVVAIVIALAGGGLVTALVAMRRVGAEKQSIIVDAAQGAVIVQQGVIDSLQDQLDRAKQELGIIHETLAEVEARLEECEDARDGFRREIRRLEMDQLGREGRIDRREQ